MNYDLSFSVEERVRLENHHKLMLQIRKTTLKFLGEALKHPNLPGKLSLSKVSPSHFSVDEQCITNLQHGTGALCSQTTILLARSSVP